MRTASESVCAVSVLIQLRVLTTFRPSVPEEGLQQLGTTTRQHASAYFHSMIQLGMVQHLHHRMDCARFWIVSAVYQAFYPCMHQSTCAHGAGLNRGKHFAIFQAVVAQVRTGLAQGNNFGMGGGVGVDEAAIPASTYNLAGMHDHCADWNLARFQRSLCGAQSLFHPEFVGDSC